MMIYAAPKEAATARTTAKTTSRKKSIVRWRAPLMNFR